MVWPKGRPQLGPETQASHQNPVNFHRFVNSPLAKATSATSEKFMAVLRVRR
jgi:hypothetical protein